MHLLRSLLVIPWLGAALVGCQCDRLFAKRASGACADPVTGESLEAARTALAKGATSVSLSTEGCLKYERTVQGNLLVSEKLVDNGVEVLTFTRTAQKTIGKGDFDRDGFAEWASVVTRGAGALAAETVTTTSSPTKGPIARTTYTWHDAATIHVAMEVGDGKGGLVKARQFDIPRFQGDGPSSGRVSTKNCTPAQAELIEQRLGEAMDGDPADKSSGGLSCLHRLGQRDKELRLTAAYMRDIEIECVTDPDIGAVYDGASWFGLGSTSIRVNPANFKNLESGQQRHKLFHEMLHELGEHDLENLKSYRAKEIDPTEACAETCWPDRETTKCSCALCLGTDSSDPRCAKFQPCLPQAYEASGTQGDVIYSGVICSLEKPFKVTGTGPLGAYPFIFVPTSATAGTMSYVATLTTPIGGKIKASGGGPYTVEGSNTDTPRIVIPSQSTASHRSLTVQGGGTATINLLRSQSVQCMH